MSLLPTEEEIERYNAVQRSFLNSIGVYTSSKDPDVPVSKPVFVFEGDGECSPIPRDDPVVQNPNFSKMVAQYELERQSYSSYEPEGKWWDDDYCCGDDYYGDCDYYGGGDDYSEGESSAIIDLVQGHSYTNFKALKIPFSSASQIKGAFLCLEESDSASTNHNILFTFTHYKEKKLGSICKKFEFPEKRKKATWFYLPIGLDSVYQCDIENKMKVGRYGGSNIKSLFFIRKETDPESAARESKEKRWYEAPPVKSIFIKEGDSFSSGRDSIPIPRDDPSVVDLSLKKIKATDKSLCPKNENYDKTHFAREMLIGRKDCLTVSYLSIPFSSPDSLKGAYICVGNCTSSPSLLFTFIHANGKKTLKRYEFEEPKNYYEWHFLPINLENVEICEIEGKGTWNKKNRQIFDIHSLVFVKPETLADRVAREIRQENLKVAWSETPITKSEFIEGVEILVSVSVPRFETTLVHPSYDLVKAKEVSLSRQVKEYDRSHQAQKLLRGENLFGHNSKELWLSHLSVPFPSPSHIKGANICINDDTPSLLFSFTNCDGKKIYKKYEFIDFNYKHHEYEWHFLHIDLSNVVLCEIEVERPAENRNFGFFSFNFVREETPEERDFRVSRNAELEKQWKAAIAGKAISKKLRDIPSRGESFIAKPVFSLIEGKKHCLRSESQICQLNSAIKGMVMKGRSYLSLSYLSIPFSSPCDLKGAYIDVSISVDEPFSLLFIFTHVDGTKTFISCEFGKANKLAYFSIDLSDIIQCEIEGEGLWMDNHYGDFKIRNLLFIRKETPEEESSRKFRETNIKKLWSEAQSVTPQYIKEGDKDSIPIPRDHSSILNPSFSMVQAYNDLEYLETNDYDQTLNAQGMLKGECSTTLTHLSIPFPSPSPMFGVFICIHQKLWGISLLFTLKYSDGKKRSKVFNIMESKGKNLFSEWYFLPIQSSRVILCEIQGKTCFPNDRVQGDESPVTVLSMVFVRKKYNSLTVSQASSAHKKTLKTPQISPTKQIKRHLKQLKNQKKKQQKKQKKKQATQGQNKQKKQTKKTPEKAQEQSHEPFEGEKDSTKIIMEEKEVQKAGKEEEKEDHGDVIQNAEKALLPFQSQNEPVEEEELSTAHVIQIVKPEFVCQGDRFPISRASLNIKSPSLLSIIAFNENIEKGSFWYGQSSQAQKMVKGEPNNGYFTHISIPFSSPSPMKGAYICLDGSSFSSPSHLIFTLTSSRGEKTSKRFEFSEYLMCRWFFLPVDLPDVFLCEISGKRMGKQYFQISSLFFIRGDDIPSSLPLPTPDLSSSSQTSKEVSIVSSKAEEKAEEKDEEKDEKEDEKEDLEEEVKEVKEEKESEESEESEEKEKDDTCTKDHKQDHKQSMQILTSSSTVTPQCVIGCGEFCETVLVNVDGVAFPCVLKKMLQSADQTVVKACEAEFKTQLKLFYNPKCFHRIPRPLYILDLLDDNYKGVYGFLMEFCVGGSVSSFAKRWCVDD
ncbi:hypothetical protein ADUPG1_009829, partial [Aduncisulcus paluster]